MACWCTGIFHFETEPSIDVLKSMTPQPIRNYIYVINLMSQFSKLATRIEFEHQCYFKSLFPHYHKSLFSVNLPAMPPNSVINQRPLSFHVSCMKMDVMLKLLSTLRIWQRIVNRHPNTILYFQNKVVLMEITILLWFLFCAFQDLCSLQESVCGNCPSRSKSYRSNGMRLTCKHFFLYQSFYLRILICWQVRFKPFSIMTFWAYFFLKSYESFILSFQ